MIFSNSEKLDYRLYIYEEIYYRLKKAQLVCSQKIMSPEKHFCTIYFSTQDVSLLQVCNKNRVYKLNAIYKACNAMQRKVIRKYSKCKYIVHIFISDHFVCELSLKSARKI